MMEIGAHLEQVARHLLGQPNTVLSKSGELRFGTNGSMSINLNDGVWYDHENAEGGGVLDLVSRENGCSKSEAVDWLATELDIHLDDSKPTARQTVVARYIYTDADGNPVGRVTRKGPAKQFYQERKTPSGWIAKGFEPIAYRLPEVRAAIANGDTIYIVEGEKDADRLAEAGLTATCNPGGAGKWRETYAELFGDASVVLLPDNDDAGRKLMRDVARKLTGTAREIKTLELPGLPEKGDVSDWVDSDHTVAELQDLAAAAAILDKGELVHADHQLSALGGLVCASDLAGMEFPPTKFVVPKYLPEGLTILAGKPKLGKNWMCLDFAVAVASGGTAFGTIPVVKGDVLYLALEDSQRRLQQRMGMIRPDMKWPARLAFATACACLDQGGVEAIKAWLDAQEAPRLVIIDTLQRVRGSSKKSKTVYAEDYDATGELHALASERGIAVVIVHHARKPDADDPLDTVSGSTGLTAAVDTIIVLKRESAGATLYVRGRDLEDIETAVRFEHTAVRWSILGEAAEVHRSDQRTAILEVLLDAGEAIGPKEIAVAAEMSDLNVRALLLKMSRDGQVVKVGRGRYLHPDIAKQDDTPGNSGNNDNSSPNNTMKAAEDLDPELNRNVTGDVTVAKSSETSGADEAQNVTSNVTASSEPVTFDGELKPQEPAAPGLGVTDVTGDRVVEPNTPKQRAAKTGEFPPIPDRMRAAST